MDDVSERTGRTRLLPSKKRLRHDMASAAESDTAARDGRVSQSRSARPAHSHHVLVGHVVPSLQSVDIRNPSPPFRTASPWCDRPSLARAAAPQQPEGRRLLAAGVNRRTLRPYFVVRSDLSFCHSRPAEISKMFVGFLSVTRPLHPVRGTGAWRMRRDTPAEPMGSG